MKHSIVFITNNRADLLVEALDRVFRYGRAEEIIVVDDASNDPTYENLPDSFPKVRWIRNSSNLGPCASRNIGVKAASCECVVHLDDDSLLVDDSYANAIDTAFQNEDVGLVALPFINRNISPLTNRRAPDGDKTYVGPSFTACAYATRRSMFLERGGFREFFFYMGEESDLSLRALDEGWFTAYVDCTPVEHMQPSAKGSFRSDFHGRKNDILADFLNVPWPTLPLHLGRATVHGCVFGVQVRRPVVMLRGLMSGYLHCARLWDSRKPVRRKTLRLFEEMRKSGPRTLESARSFLLS